VLFTIEDDDDLFLYEEDDIIVAFGENETIEALIVILSLILILSRSLKLFFFFCVYFFFSLLCFGVCLCGLLIWLSVVFYINPEKERKFHQSKKTNKEELQRNKNFGLKSLFLFFFQSKKTIFNQKVLVHLYVVIHSNTHNTHEQKEHVIYHHHQISNAVLPERASLAALLLPPSADNIHQRQKCIIKSTQNREF
jgi:hypothetical protein